MILNLLNTTIVCIDTIKHHSGSTSTSRSAYGSKCDPSFYSCFSLHHPYPSPFLPCLHPFLSTCTFYNMDRPPMPPSVNVALPEDEEDTTPTAPMTSVAASCSMAVISFRGEFAIKRLTIVNEYIVFIRDIKRNT